ncbi:hypothetical protein [Streptomyces lavendofoliae]|uniref:hypothetical protein n=1 Tax=Streptomyces lavendofoliae TaxID=67314 RepID=UPI00300F358C
MARPVKALDAETRRAVRCFAGAGLVLSLLLTALCAYGLLTGRGRLSVAVAGLLLAALNAGAPCGCSAPRGGPEAPAGRRRGQPPGRPGARGHFATGPGRPRLSPA